MTDLYLDVGPGDVVLTFEPRYRWRARLMAWAANTFHRLPIMREGVRIKRAWLVDYE